ncbi:MAG: GNAT family N-acetyltransferase [Bacillota bacterium]|nr:GNAT family N-acetyltransferase [Bacillota bacterium]
MKVSYVEMNINIRRAEAKDISDVFELSNSNSTRQYSINANEILWKEHLSWFNEVLKTEGNVLYVFHDEKNEFLGQVRYNIEFKSAEISISIVNELKGKGYGLEILKKSQDLLIREKDIVKIVAIIHGKNIPSIKLFERAGYKFSKSDNDFSEYILNI